MALSCPPYGNERSQCEPSVWLFSTVGYNRYENPFLALMASDSGPAFTVATQAVALM